MEANTIDLNELGRYAYKQLIQSKCIPDKEKVDLTLKERESIVDISKKAITHCIKEYDNDKNRYAFTLLFYSTLISYIDNVDLNKYISLKINKKGE